MAETPLAVDVLNVQSSPGPLFEPDGSLQKISNVPEFRRDMSRRYLFLIVGRNNLLCRIALPSAPMMKRRIGGLVNNV